MEQEDTTLQPEDTTLLPPKLLNMVGKNKLKASKHRHINRERPITVPSGVPRGVGGYSPAAKAATYGIAIFGLVILVCVIYGIVLYGLVIYGVLIMLYLSKEYFSILL